jgi:hypothetical protein
VGPHIGKKFPIKNGGRGSGTLRKSVAVMATGFDAWVRADVVGEERGRGRAGCG